MKSLFKYIEENYLIDKNTKPYGVSFDIEDITKKCPNFWKAVSQFCIDKNSEEGVDFLLASFTAKTADEFNETYPKQEWPFTAKEIREFEEKYLNDEAYEEINNYIK